MKATYVPLSVIILTFNEEKNIEECLESVKDLTDNIIIVDSGSTDNTLSIVRNYTSDIFHHSFENYSKQRNWSLANVQAKYEWIMNIDADHRLTEEIKTELLEYFANGVPQNIKGFMASRRTMFMNRWIKHGGHFPVYHGVIFKKGFGECEDKEYDQHFIIKGESIKLKGTIIDIITDSLSTFTARHNKWASLEANDIVNYRENLTHKIRADKNGNAMERRRFQRLKYYSYPIFFRVFIYFFYRYVLKLGFLDGKVGLIFHFLQGFWFRFLVDAKIYERQIQTTKLEFHVLSKNSTIE